MIETTLIYAHFLIADMFGNDRLNDFIIVTRGCKTQDCKH